MIFSLLGVYFLGGLGIKASVVLPMRGVCSRGQRGLMGGGFVPGPEWDGHPGMGVKPSLLIYPNWNSEIRSGLPDIWSLQSNIMEAV